jgi:hypothetical protein
MTQAKCIENKWFRLSPYVENPFISRAKYIPSAPQRLNEAKNFAAFPRGPTVVEDSGT